MPVRLLGPVEVSCAGAAVDVGPPRQRAVLAALAADAGRPVPVDVLVDRVWGSPAPARAGRTLHTYIARTRRLAEVLTAAGGGPVGVVRRSDGYLLDIDAEEVDLHRFQRLVERARELRDDDRERARMLRDAIGLWRGRPLADLRGDWPDRVRQAWAGEHLDAVLAWARVELRLGRPDPVLRPLTGLAAEHPLVEPVAATLIRALHAAGRTAEALDRYTAMRARLAAELGAGPGPDLRAAHQQALRGDGHRTGDRPAEPGLPRAAAAGGMAAGPLRPARTSGPPVPAQLPRDAPAFTGRAAELRALDRVLDRTERTPAVVVISGAAGVGKTALAVRWAHRTAATFPDGQLHVDLRGYHPDEPMAPAEALAGFLRELGVPGDELPTEPAEQAARFRTLVAGRRMVLVLDNARSAEQVRPLLPGTPSCSVLVTSRDSLAGLIARDGAGRLDLDLLPVVDALELLRRLLGQRVDADPAAAADLVRRCARLPLALRVAAEVAASRPAEPLRALADELADEDRLLDLLDAGGDRGTAVRAVLSWSYRQLGDDAGRLFRLLGLHPGSELDAHAAAALADTDPATARRLLTVLLRAHLVQESEPGRVRMHDLLRAYAAERAAAESVPDGQAALSRLFDYYLAAVLTAMDTLVPVERDWRAPAPAPAAALPDLANPVAARTWLDRERENLPPVVAYAATRGWPAHAIRLAAALPRYLATGAHYLDALAIHRHAASAARASGDLHSEATAASNIGGIYWRWGRFQDATDQCRQALDLHRRAGDRPGEGRSLNNLGVLLACLGQFPRARECLDEALAIAEEIADRRSAGRRTANLGHVFAVLGRHAEALELCRRAVAVADEVGDRTGAASARTNLAFTYCRMGRGAEALQELTLALSMAEGLDRGIEIEVRDCLGLAYRLLGRGEDGLAAYRTALSSARESGCHSSETSALNGLGETLSDAGRRPEARDAFRAALDLARRTGDRYQQARALAGIAGIRTDGDATAVQLWAHRCRTEALALFTELGVPR